ncbi:MAG: hypothetical protein NZ480_00015 [Bdellovibrionaceae bacterium]|nr:hypothetical protein [Pseudobdellovibrionaceae bacterium]
MIRTHKMKSRGLTIVETMVAIGIVGITAVAMMYLNNYLEEQTEEILQKAEILKILSLIDYDIYQEMDFIPYRSDDGIAYIYSMDLDFVKLKDSFKSKGVFSRCYSMMGQRVALSSSECEFVVEYYKIPEIDRLYGVEPNGEFNVTGASRLVYRITFTEKVTKKQIVQYYSRLKANVLSF